MSAIAVEEGAASATSPAANDATSEPRPLVDELSGRRGKT